MTDQGNDNAFALMQCANCKEEHHFEQLSRKQLLCQKCRHYLPFSTCPHCETEFFVLGSDLAGRNEDAKRIKIKVPCKKCKEGLKSGPSKACEICSLPAAFGHHVLCVSCSHLKKRHGDPVSCGRCQKDRAFKGSSSSKHPLYCRICQMKMKKKRKKKPSDQDSTHGSETSHSKKLKRTSDGPPPVPPVPTDNSFSPSVMEMTPSSAALISRLQTEIGDLKHEIEAQKRAVLDGKIEISALKGQQEEALKGQEKHFLAKLKKSGEKITSLQLESAEARRTIDHLNAQIARHNKTKRATGDAAS